MSLIEFKGCMKIIANTSCSFKFKYHTSLLKGVLLLVFQFDSPVAKAWILRNGVLKTISVFDNKHIPALPGVDNPQDPAASQPLLYVGTCLVLKNTVSVSAANFIGSK